MLGFLTAGFDEASLGSPSWSCRSIPALSPSFFPSAPPCVAQAAKKEAAASAKDDKKAAGERSFCFHTDLPTFRPFHSHSAVGLNPSHSFSLLLIPSHSFSFLPSPFAAAAKKDAKSEAAAAKKAAAMDKKAAAADAKAAKVLNLSIPLFPI